MFCFFKNCFHYMISFIILEACSELRVVLLLKLFISMQVLIVKDLEDKLLEIHIKDYLKLS